MNYKYPSIYKYAFLLIVIYLFMKHQNIMSQDKLLLNSIVITIIIGIVDFVIIQDHPLPLDNNVQSETFKGKFDEDSEAIDLYDIDFTEDE